jgi:hypothetical protein
MTSLYACRLVGASCRLLGECRKYQATWFGVDRHGCLRRVDALARVPVRGESL